MKKELYKLTKDGVILYQWEVNIPEASDFGSPNPPIPPPVTYPCDKCTLTFTTQILLDAHKVYAHPVIPPTNGKWAATLAGAYKMNTKITENGVGKGLGYGYYRWYQPGPITLGAGQLAYFIIDPNGYTGLDYKGRTIMVFVNDFDQSAIGSAMNKGSIARIIEVDKSGNEIKVISSLPSAGNGTFQVMGGFYYTDANRVYIVEVTQGDLRGATISINWSL